jgi:hypothetical protein
LLEPLEAFSGKCLVLRRVLMLMRFLGADAGLADPEAGGRSWMKKLEGVRMMKKMKDDGVAVPEVPQASEV